MSLTDDTNIKILRPVDKQFKISSEFGERIHPITKEKSFHKGIDFACPEGTVTRACFDGVVTYIKTKEDGNGAGNRLGLYNQKHRALYFHLKDSGFLCEVGQKVNKGTTLALSGNTGNTTGPHLHFELRILSSDLPIKPEFEDNYDNTAVT